MPNEFIRQVACRLDLHHLKPENESTGAAVPSSEVRSCDSTRSRSSVSILLLWLKLADFQSIFQFLTDYFLRQEPSSSFSNDIEIFSRIFSEYVSR